MKQFTLASCVALAALSFTGCGLNDSEPQASALPGAETFVYELPSSIASTGAASGAARTLAAAGQSEDSLFFAYKPVPAYIGFAEQMRGHVVGFINSLPPLPPEFNHEENGTTVVGRTIDTLGQTLFNIDIVNSNTSEHLAMRYWKNARDQYKGDFLFEAGNGDKAYITFNNHNEELLGRRMNIVATRQLANLEDAGAPSVVVVRAVKRGDKVFVGGASYHPTFQDTEDAFWYLGELTPSVYAFAAVANSSKDVAVLKAAFGPADSVAPGFLEAYRLDDQVMNQGVNFLNNAMASDTGLLNGFWWSVDRTQTLDSANITANWLDFVGYAATNSHVPGDVTTADLIAFSEINADSDASGQMGQWANFAHTRQPIFLSTGAVIAGNEESLAANGVDQATFGVQALDLDNAELANVATDPAEIISLDADTLQVNSLPDTDVAP